MGGAIAVCGKGYSCCVAVIRGERKLLIATSFLGNTLDRISRIIPMDHIAGLEMAVQYPPTRLHSSQCCSLTVLGQAAVSMNLLTSRAQETL